MGYTGGGSSDKRGSTSSGGNGKSRPRSNGGGSGRRREWEGYDTSDDEAGGGEGVGALDCDESLDAAATDDEVCHAFACRDRHDAILPNLTLRTGTMFRCLYAQPATPRQHCIGPRPMLTSVCRRHSG